MNNDITSISSESLLSDQAEYLGALTSTYDAPALSDKDILNALEHPLRPDGKSGPVFDLVRPGETVCLVVSDHTRKTAVDRVLPVLLRGLTERKCLTKDMFILVACGIHRHPTTDETRTILGTEIVKAFEGRIFFHDPDDERNLVSIGTTRRGHDVRINRRAKEADRLILLGAALYHYHAGFGGGRKSLIPGLAARSTIAHNHSLTLDPVHNQIHAKATIGVLDGNPVSEEMLESARLCPPDFIINTVLCPDGSMAGVFAGEMDTALRAACRLVEQINRVNLEQPADFVIASAGTAANWIQSHKALFNALRAIRPNGRVILVAPCQEGLGDKRFRHWITRATVEDIYAGLRQNPEVLGQTALSTRTRGPRTILVTDLNQQDIADLGIPTAPDLD
ncbi:nickel-dependent lactate racemase, partial [Verrucomicrobiota bacterium]